MDHNLLTIIYRIRNSCQVNGRAKGRAQHESFLMLEYGARDAERLKVTPRRADCFTTSPPRGAQCSLPGQPPGVPAPVCRPNEHRRGRAP